MADFTDGRMKANAAAVEGSTKSIRQSIVPRSILNFSTSGQSGTIAAALAANSTVFAMRLDPGSTRNAFIESVELQFTTIVGFTVPITAGRRLGIFRGGGATSSGGTAISEATYKDTAYSSEFDSINGGDIRVSTTAALTITGIVYETQPIALLSLAHVGAAGNSLIHKFVYNSSENSPIMLTPGQLLAVRNPVIMDAAGTWQLVCNVNWHEATAYNATTE